MDAVYSEPNIVIRNDLEELILRYNDQAEEIVRLALKQWSPNIREYVRTETGLKMGDVTPILRIALTGTMQGPAVFEVAELLGKRRTVARLEAFNNKL